MSRDVIFSGNFEFMTNPGWWPPWMSEFLNIISLSIAGAMAVILLLVFAVGCLALALGILLQILSLFGTGAPRDQRRERSLPTPAIEQARHRAINPRTITHLEDER